MKVRDYFFISAFVLYVIIISIIIIFYGAFINAHTFVLFLFFFALLIGQSASFLREFIPFTVIIFAYEILRGYADNMAGYVNIDNIIRLERTLFGNIPTIVLQEKFYTHGSYHIYDFLTFTLWALHFVVPLAFSFLLWKYKKTLYWQFILSLLCLTFAGFITYILFPVAPPWLASQVGSLEHVTLIRNEIIKFFSFGMPVALFISYATPNQVAAMPSLHAAYPCLVFLYVLRYFRKIAPLVFIYCIALWTSLVYGGDHYVVDVIAGIVYAIILFLIVERAVKRTYLKELIRIE